MPCQVEGEVIHQEVTFKPRKQLIVQIADDSGSVLFLRFIHFYASHQKQMAAGKRIRAVGEIKHGFYGDEMIHPKIRDAESSGLAESLTPIYPTVNGLNQPTLRRIIQTALDVTPLHDTLPDALLGRLKLPPPCRKPTPFAFAAAEFHYSSTFRRHAACMAAAQI